MIIIRDIYIEKKDDLDLSLYEIYAYLEMGSWLQMSQFRWC